MIYGYLGLVRQEISMINLLMPTIILIVGMSDFIHFYSGFIENLNKGLNVLASIKVTIKEIGMATFLTSATTAIGFLTLVTIPIRPIRFFGIDSAFGVLSTFIITILILPGILSTIKQKETHRLARNEFVLFTRLLEFFIKLINKYPSQILGISIILILISLIGILRIDTNGFILSKLKENSPIKKDFYYFEQQFCGIRDLEIIISINEGFDFYNQNVFREMEKLQDHLEEYGFVRTVLSPVILYKTYNMIYQGDGSSSYRLPEDSEGIQSLYRQIGRYNRSIEKNYYCESENKARMQVLYRDIGSEKNNEFLDNLNHWVNENLSTNVVSLGYTGYALLYDRANQTIIKNMALSLMLALLVISAIISILFRKLSMVVIFLLPNILPLMMLGALLTVFGLELHGSLAMVFTIGFVIIVDDTIHFLIRYKLLLKKGKSKKEANILTLRETGRAIILSSILIFLGFVLLISSHFYEIAYFGILLSISSFIAMFADLLLLPVLLIKFVK